MTHKITKVTPREDFTLLLLFDSGEQKLFDVSLYLDKGIFKELHDLNYFRQVKPFFGGVSWPHEQDFSADTRYLESKSVPGGVAA